MRRLLPLPIAASLCVVLAGFGLQGCTRTYDGTVVPAYQVGMVRAGLIPRPTLRKTPTERPDTGKIFPIAPLPPGPATPAPRKRRAAIVAAAQKPGAPKPAVRCQQPSDSSGRVRMVCD